MRGSKQTKGKQRTTTKSASSGQRGQAKSERSSRQPSADKTETSLKSPMKGE